MSNNLLLNFKKPVKWGLAIAGVLCFGLGQANAQSAAGFTFQSIAQNGNWSNPTTWQRWQTGVPNATVIMGQPGDPIPDATADQITILKDFPVVVDIDVTVDQLVIEAGATLTVANSKKVTVNNGTGTDITVQGTLVSLGGATDADANFIHNANSKIAFSSTGIYKHSPAVKVGVIPTADWDPLSTIIFNYSGTGPYSDVQPSRGFSQSFGNVKWDTPALTSAFFLNGQLQDIKGSFEVINTGSSAAKLVLSQSGTYTLSVAKDFIINSNAKVGFTRQTITPIANVPGTLELKLKRDLIVYSGAQFDHVLLYNGSTPALNVKFEGSSRFNVVPALSNMNFMVMPASDLTLDVDYNSLPVSSSINVNGTLHTGTKFIAGPGNFSLNAGGTISTGWQAGISSTGGPVRTTGKSFSTGANYIYNRNTTGVFQNTGDLLPATVAGLTIDNPYGLTLTAPVSVTSKLTLTKGIVNATVNTLSLTSGATVSKSENLSYVNGPVTYSITTPGPNTIVFPVGSANVYRPVTLTFNQTNNTPTTYTASLISGQPATRTIPEDDITHVSKLRYYNITKGTGSPMTGGYVTFSYAADDMVTDPTKLVVAKSDGTAWKSLGGSVIGQNVQTTIPFDSFSDFVLANAKGGNNPLPVEFISFNAVKTNKTVNLTWETASEKNNDFFAVERSLDGRNFEVIGKVKGAGNSNALNAYAFADKNPVNGISYYRLKQTDFDGKAEYSNIVSVTFEGKSTVVINAYPNPAVNVLNVNVKGVTGRANVEITDVTGRSIKQVLVNAGETTSLNVEALPKGLYQIRVTSNNGTTVSKFIKQ